MTYPLTLPHDGDPRFTGQLLDEIAAVLTAHGYPSLSDDDTDFAGLRGALERFLYGLPFNIGDKVTWTRNGKVWDGRVDCIAADTDGPVARIIAGTQLGVRGPFTVIVPCRDLTLVPDGAR